MTAVVPARSRPLPTTLLITRCQDSWHWFEGTVPAMFVLSRPGVVASCEARLHTSHGGRKYSFHSCVVVYLPGCACKQCMMCEHEVQTVVSLL